MATGRKIGGAVANQFAAGNVYNKYNDSYAPQTGARMGLGALEQFGGPMGSIAGMIGGWALGRKPGAEMAWQQQRKLDYGAGEHVGLRQHFDTGQVPDVGINPNQAAPTLHGFMTGQPSMSGGFMGHQPLSQFGPMAGGYQFAPQAPQGSGFNTGLPNHQMGYASLPNYGQAPVASSGYGGRGSGVISGGAQGNFGFQGYASAADRASSIAGAQESFRGMKQSELAPQRQMGTDPRGFRVVS